MRKEHMNIKKEGKQIRHIGQRFGRKHVIALSFFMPLIVMTGCCIAFGIQPFGDNSLLIIDGLHQYMPFYSVLYDKLKGGESLFYSFRSGLGINFLSLFSYYLSSPLNLLIIFFKKTQLNMAVSMIIVLKIALSGMTAGIYFSSKSKKQGLHVLMISMAYALSSYMVGYCWNVMWLDAIMIFPIVVMGLERLIDKKDGRLYCLALFYALYCNYYIAFMICIFAIIWYIFYSFKSVKQFFFRGISFALYSFLAAGMAAVLLIPAYLGIKQTASGEAMTLPDHSFLTNAADLLNRQFAMGSPISHDNFDGNANLYIGIFTVLAVGLYLLNQQIKISDKIKKILLVGFFYLSFGEMILNFIWHGFHDQYGIPSIVLADGPGGIRVKQKYEAKNVETGETATYYQYCTAWPVDFVLAQSWDTDLLKRIGEAFGKELEEMNITILLGPSLNIHRDPLCGRNFEYFSEDPVISGTMASAITLGVQEEPGVGACLKHFSANNQETDRSGTDSIVSERALREIYLKGFEIAVKESKPMSIMTSYNQINGVPAADSYDMNTNIARGEWGFEGLIMTDWNGGVSHPSTSMHAGNDLIMPGGASKANEIIIGAEDVKPTFEANGQIGLKDELMYMFSYKSAAWGDFEVSADGTQTAEAKLGDDYTASVGEDGKILVNGQEIYREYQANVWAGTGNYKTPVTTDVASVSEDGKTIVYKGTYKENNNICLGDVQKSAINNLKVIMQSRDMARIYGTTTRSYTALCGDLTNYQTVNKSEITTERTLKENLDQAKKDLEEAKKNLEELQKQNAAKDAEIAKAKAEVEAAKKDLQAAKMAAKKAAVKSVKSKKAGKAIVTVKKVAGAEGYQVQYSLKKSMKSAKNVKIKKNSITIKRLKKGKTYYVRVRAFSKDSNGKQICTAWSTAKKVTIKK